MAMTILLLMVSVLAAGPLDGDGVIEGVVVRAPDQTPVSAAEVVLRAKVDGQLLTVAETTADAEGKFRFEHLRADGDCVYLPGANRDGIHYPGPSVQLSSLRRQANVSLAVHDAVAFPNPLLVRRHEITPSPQADALQVTESMLIDNPSGACYVGQSAGADAEPVTLQLAIPANFERVTFASEFFGRRFAMIGGHLRTGIPWPPGQRELKFSYWLPNSQRHYQWQRTLDLPSDAVRVSVRGDAPQVTCNLNRAPRQKDGEIAFEANERTLSVGYPLRVELGRMPVSAMAYAPWVALATLAVLIFATCLPVNFRRRACQSAVNRS
jgi:hypothetical protein